MNVEKPDRRTRRSQAALIHALLELIESKHYDQITVQDITELADVGRSTFYAHYQNKDDLLIAGFGHLLEVLVQEITLNQAGQLVFDTRMLFSHAAGHYKIYRTLLWGSGFELLTKDGHSVLSQKIEERLGALLPPGRLTSIPLPVLAYNLAGGLLVLLKWWLDNKMPYTPEKMDKIFQELVLTGAQRGLDLPQEE